MNNEFDNKQYNLNNNHDIPQIIGFDSITGQPIFDNGLGVREEKNEPKQVEKKVMSKGKFIFHIFLSFGLWNLVTLFIFKILMNGLIYKINNAVILLIIFNVLWIGASVLQIFLTYWFNKFNTPQEYQLRSAKNTNLIMFLILIILVNKETIARFFDINTLLSILMGVFLVIHFLAIWYVNEKIFDKYWVVDNCWRNDNLFRKTVIILISAIVLIFISIFSYRNNIEKNSVLTCIRENKDKVVIKFDVTGIDSLEINGKKASEEEFAVYLIQFMYDFSKIEMSEENYTELELIKKYMEIVTDYEENNEEYNAVCVQE